MKNLKISDLEMDKILKRWITRGVDTYGYDTREAVCSWVVENIGDIMSIIPRTHPRRMVDSHHNSRDENGGKSATAESFNLKNVGNGSGSAKLPPQAIAVQVAGVFAIIAVLAVTFFTYRFRDRRVFM